jgi:hypothetical protein
MTECLSPEIPLPFATGRDLLPGMEVVKSPNLESYSISLELLTKFFAKTPEKSLVKSQNHSSQTKQKRSQVEFSYPQPVIMNIES